MEIKALGIALMLFMAIGASNSFVSQRMHINPESSKPPYSIILMIGDGMGFNQTKLAQLVEYGTSDNLTMMDLPTHLSAKTFSANNDITDSAAAATAIATGHKTNNGVISMAPNGTSLTTILEIAKNRGKSTGLVATSYVQHATPASFMTHVMSRGDTSEITRQIVEEADVDVLLGGGWSYFSPEQITTMQQTGYSIIRNRTALIEADHVPILGLFADSNMGYEETRDFETTPSLAEMTNKSIQLLSQDTEGFFLMVEGSRIDHACHASDKVGAALEAIAFDAAVAVALDYVEDRDNTLLIVTADHETGGLSIIGNSLSDSIPSELAGEEERRDLRIERANNVTVSWSTTYHTSSNVPVFGRNPLNSTFHNDTIIDNIDIFREMKSFYDEESTEAESDPSTTTETGSSTSTTTEDESESEATDSSITETNSETTIQPVSPALILAAITLLIPGPVIVIFVLWRRKMN